MGPVENIAEGLLCLTGPIIIFLTAYAACHVLVTVVLKIKWARNAIERAIGGEIE